MCLGREMGVYLRALRAFPHKWREQPVQVITVTAVAGWVAPDPRGGQPSWKVVPARNEALSRNDVTPPKTVSSVTVETQLGMRGV